ncbi:17373_t:CDS:2 [Acaulospora colombiana]|uniref:17373_t:CDS:1 n=1 Tax=Acaulospora colombiana TaxID=27376 RepID=A0ACA9K7B2_9GLOM|nr:17373_t:CDS:2 [Acaulospora colombiana]
MQSSDSRTYFEENKTWSLIAFLRYRRDAHDFTKDRLIEHRKYKKELEDIISDNKDYGNPEWPADCALAGYCELRLLLGNRLRLYCHDATRNCVFLFERISPAVEAFWISDEIQLTKLNYAKSALSKTIDETQKIREVVSVEVIDTIGNQYGETSKRTLRIQKPVDYSENLNETNLFESDHEEKSPKEEFVKAIMTPLSSEASPKDHDFRQICEFILYDFYFMTKKGPLKRDIGERTFIVERIVPLFKAIQSVYNEYKFHWIEVELDCMREVKKIFPNFDLPINQADGLGMRNSSNKAVVFIEVLGGPENTDKKKLNEDSEKLLKEAVFGLVSLLRNYLDKSAEESKQLYTFIIRGIGNLFDIH